MARHGGGGGDNIVLYGIKIPSIEDLLSFKKPKYNGNIFGKTYVKLEEKTIGINYAIYDLDYAIQSMVDGNSVILELLFYDREQYLFTNDFGKRLLEIKELFLSNKIQDNLRDIIATNVARLNPCTFADVNFNSIMEKNNDILISNIIRLYTLGIILIAKKEDCLKIPNSEKDFTLNLEKGVIPKKDSNGNLDYSEIIDLIKKHKNAFETCCRDNKLEEMKDEALNKINNTVIGIKLDWILEMNLCYRRAKKYKGANN